MTKSRDGVFQIPPLALNGIRMSLGLRINEIKMMVHLEVFKSLLHTRKDSSPAGARVRTTNAEVLASAILETH